MEITLGDAEAFSVGTIQEVLQRYRQHIRADLEQEVQLQRDRTDEETSRRMSAEAETSQVLDEFATYRESQTSRVDTLARQLARAVSRAVFWIAGAVSLGVPILSLPPPFPDFVDGSPRWFSITVGIAMLAVLLLSAANLSVGTSIRGLATACEEWLSERLRRLLQRHLSP